jgi:hypothetical protein
MRSVAIHAFHDEAGLPEAFFHAAERPQPGARTGGSLGCPGGNGRTLRQSDAARGGTRLGSRRGALRR